MKKISLILVLSVFFSLISAPCYTKGEESINFDLLAALDIITEDDNYETRLDSPVTRIEFAELFARTMKFNIDETGADSEFKDIAAGTLSAGIVNAVYENGFMVGYGDGNFYPNENITGIQALKMAVDAVNYSFLADNYGGWPQGYQKAGSEIGLTDGVPAGDKAINFREALKLIENMLTAPYVYFSEVNDESEYDRNNPVSLLTERHRVFQKEGIVTGNNTTKLSFLDGVPEGSIEIDDISYYVDDDLDAGRYLGYRIDFYYRIDSGDKTVICIIRDRKNSELLIESDEIADFDDNVYSYFEGSGTKNAKISDIADVIYNQKAYLGNDAGIYLPQNGRVELIDNDGDGYYDVVKIIDIRIMVISSYQENSNRIYDILNPSVPLNVDANDPDIKVSVKTASGKDLSLSELARFDVAEACVSLDGTVVDITLSSESFDGEILGIREEDGDTYLDIDGDEYKVAGEYMEYINNIGSSPELGKRAKFYLASSGAIAYIDMSSAEDDGQYVYMIKTYIGENEELIIKALTTENEMKKFTAAEKIQIDTVKKLDAYKAKETLDSKLLYTPPPTETDPAPEPTMTPIVAYIELNADGFIKYIDTPKGELDKDAENTLHVAAEPGAYLWHVGAKNITSSLNCNDDTIVFVAPEVHETADDSDYSAIPANEYFVHFVTYSGVKGYSRDRYAVFCDVVTHVGSSESMFTPERKLFLIQGIDVVLDGEEEPTYRIKGLENGVQAEYMLKDESVINEVYKLGGTAKAEGGIQKGDAVRFTLNSDKEVIRIEKIYSGSQGVSYMEYNPQYSNIPGNIVDGNVDELTPYFKSNGDFANAFRCFVGNAFYKTDGYVRLVNPIFNLYDSKVINFIDSGAISLENFQMKNVFLYDENSKEVFVPASPDAISDFVTAGRASRVLIATNEYDVMCMVIFKQ